MADKHRKLSHLEKARKVVTRYGTASSEQSRKGLRCRNEELLWRGIGRRRPQKRD
jgi:hypothetical protein